MKEKSRPKQSAKEAAVGLLSRRDHAEQELRKKLKQKGYTPEEVGEAIAYCQDYSWLDDVRFARMALRSGVAKGWGWLRIVQEMRYKGLHQTVITQLQEQDETDWFAQAREVARRKFGELTADTPKEKAKRFRFMQYRGFDFEQIQYALAMDDED